LLVEIRFDLLLWLLIYVLKIKRSEILIALLRLLTAGNKQLNLVSKEQDFLVSLTTLRIWHGI